MEKILLAVLHATLQPEVPLPGRVGETEDSSEHPSDALVLHPWTTRTRRANDVQLRFTQGSPFSNAARISPEPRIVVLVSEHEARLKDPI